MEPISVAYIVGGGLQPEDDDRQGVFGTQMLTNCENVTSLAPTAQETAQEGSSGPKVEALSDTWGEALLSLENENSSGFEKQSTSGKVLNNAPAADKTDSIHAMMMWFEPLLEASGERNQPSFNLTYRDYPCHCVTETVWYPEKSNLCSIWDVEEIRSIGLLDHQQKVTQSGRLEASFAMD